MIRLGVIGDAQLDNFHIEQVKSRLNVETIGQFIPEKSKTNHQNKFKEYSTFEELLGESDAILISDSTISNFFFAQQSLKLGKPILLENPISISLSETLELVHTSKESDVICAISYKDRLNKAFSSVKEQVDNPLFIETHRLMRYSNKLTANNIILDSMIYDVDMALNIAKSEINRISATGLNILSDSLDIANARLEFSNGCIANLTASRISQAKMHKIRIFQKEAYYNIDFLSNQSERISLKDTQLNITADASGEQAEYFNISTKTFPTHDAMQAQLEDFLECVIEHKTPISTAETSYKSMDVAHQILRKINSLKN